MLCGNILSHIQLSMDESYISSYHAKGESEFSLNIFFYFLFFELNIVHVTTFVVVVYMGAVHRIIKMTCARRTYACTVKYRFMSRILTPPPRVRTYVRRRNYCMYPVYRTHAILKYYL